MGNENLERVLKNNSAMKNSASRIVLLYTDIADNVSADVCQAFLELQKSDPITDITLMINSYGGEVDECWAIIDLINIITPDVRTIINGKAMSAGAFIAISGTPGKRFATKNSRIMLHTLSGGAVGNYYDVQIDIDEMKRMNEKLINLVSERSKLSVSDVQELLNRNKYISPEEAIELGLIDGILEKLN